MTNYLQSSGIFGVLAILTGLVVAITGILVPFLARSRRAHVFCVISSGLPILVGATGTLMAYIGTRDFMLNSSNASDENVVRQWYSELASPTIVGVVTGLPLFILLSVLFAFRSRRLQETRQD